LVKIQISGTTNGIAVAIGIVAGLLLGVLSNRVYESLKQRGLAPKSPTFKRWLILVLSLVPLLSLVTLPEIIPEDRSDSRVTILATIDAIGKQRQSLDEAEDVLKAQQTSGTRQPGSAVDPTQAAITDALARLEVTSQALDAQLAGLEKRLPTSSPDLTVTPLGECQVGGNAPFESELVALINAQRAAHELPPLGSQAQLARAARAHSIDMACGGFFSHTGSSGTSPGDRIGGEGYRWSIFAENVAGGYGSPQDVITGWMDSLDHRANILSPGFVDVGVGYAFGSLSEYGNYWTAVFAAP
jgi:uncharacterized protein YkwD